MRKTLLITMISVCFNQTHAGTITGVNGSVEASNQNVENGNGNNGNNGNGNGNNGNGNNHTHNLPSTIEFSNIALDTNDSITGSGDINITGMISGATLTSSDTITAAGLATLNGGATVNGGSTLNGGATVNDGSTLNGGATVNGGSTLNGGATVNGGLTVTGTSLLDGDASITGDFNVAGTSTLNEVVVTGSLSNTNASGNRSVEIENGQFVTTGPNGGSVVVSGQTVTSTSANGKKTTTVNGSGVTATHVNGDNTSLSSSGVSATSANGDAANLDSAGLTSSTASGTTTVSGGSVVIQTAPVDPNARTAGATSAFSIKATRLAEQPEGGMSAFALPIEEDVFNVDIDGNVQTEGNIDAAGTISAQAMVVNGVDVGSTLNRLDSRLNKVEKNAYRGIAIALAAQQNVPNIKPGQFAVFGGMGFYQGESAGAMGVVGSINQRASVSAAVGIAGGSEVGGRVGVAYVFGGK